MPNWCDCELKVSGPRARLEEFAAFVKGKDKEDYFDFEKIVPYPEGFNRELKSPSPDVSLLRKSDAEAAKALTKQYEGYAKEHPDGWKNVDIPARVKEEIATFPAYRRNLEIAGVPSWYEWCHQNWGTKWNACSCQEPQFKDKKSKLVVFCFETAWAPPEPVVYAASKMFPDLTFSLRYWEGGMGFKGSLKVKSGIALKDQGGDYHGSRGG